MHATTPEPEISQSSQTSQDESVLIDINHLRHAINVEFENLNYFGEKCKGKTQRHILKDLVGTFYSGRLTAILGPSGAGKSSFLNVISRFKTTGVTGKITTNGSSVSHHAYRQMCAYIPQEFALLTKLTCLETLYIAADLKLSSKVSKTLKQKIITNIIEILKLQKCLHTYVCQMSGGEKKRLSIGTELLTNPPLMFFDEPTSGLDSSSSLQIISHLKDLAKTGRTIICVIHQPSSRLLEFFDDVFVLSEGRCIYRGPVIDIVDTFQKLGFVCPNYYNRADFALEVASRDRDGNLDGLVSKFSSFDNKIKSDYMEKYLDEKSPFLPDNGLQININVNVGRSRKQYPVSWLTQFFILTRRNILCMIRDILFVQLRFISHILIALLIGTVFHDIGNEASKIQSNTSCLFFFLLFIFFANSMPTVLSFPLEATVFLREHLNNYYSLSVYYVAKMVAELPLQIIGPTSFILVAYFLTGQPYDSDRLLKIWAVCLLIGVIAELMGLVSGAICDMQLGTFIVPCLAIPMLIFSGFFIKFKELSTIFKPLTYFSYFRYGFEGSIQAVYGFNRTSLHCSEVYCYYKHPKKFLDDIGMSDSNYYADIFGLVGWVIGLQIILYIALWVKLKRAQ